MQITKERKTSLLKHDEWTSFFNLHRRLKSHQKNLNSFDRSISNDRTTTTTKKHQNVMIRHYSNFLSKENFVYFELLFVLRINIMISFDVTTKKTRTTKKRAKVIFTKTKRARKSFQIVFSTETFKNQISRSVMIAKEKTKKNTEKKLWNNQKKYYYGL